MINKQDWTAYKRLLFMQASGGSASEYTATGNPLSFNTNLAKPLSLTIPFTPTQSGTGDPSPTNVRPISGVSAVNVWQTGKNLFDASAVVRRDGKLINDSGVEQNSTISGYTQNYISVSGNTKYTISGTIVDSGSSFRLYYYDEGKEWIERTGIIQIQSVPFTFTTPINCGYMQVQYNVASVDFATIQIELGESATPYTPYTGQSFNITFPALGKNLLDPSRRTAAGNNVQYYRTGDRLLLKGGQTYTLSANVSTSQFTIFTGNNTPVASTMNQTLTYTPTEDIDVWIDIYVGNAILPEGGIGVVYGMLEVGDTAHTYEPYTNTVYGGSLDVTTGVLTVEWARKKLSEIIATHGTEWGGRFSGRVDDMAQSSFSANGVMCSCYESSTTTANDYIICVSGKNIYLKDTRYETVEAFVEAMGDYYAYYKLATPITYQLTPQQITALIGDNTIWSDTNGSNTAVYLKKG